MAAILAACLAGPGPLGVRDAAMAALMHSTGLRRAEVAAALIERYDASERALKVIGKGNKERTVYHFTSMRSPTSAVGWHSSAAAAARCSGLSTATAISRPVISAPGLVGHIVDRRHDEAGLPPTSTHDFRRTFIGDYLDAGGDLAQAQALAMAMRRQPRQRPMTGALAASAARCRTSSTCRFLANSRKRHNERPRVAAAAKLRTPHPDDRKTVPPLSDLVPGQPLPALPDPRARAAFT